MNRLHSCHPQKASEQDYDMIVVGAGVVGCALAFSLGTTGRRVLLLERDLSEPDRIVGELLQPGGCNALSKMGLLGCLDEIDARLAKGYQVYWGSTSVSVPYPLIDETARLAFSESGLSGQDFDQDATMRAQGRSFHHGRFVQALRRKAASHSNVTLVEATVIDLRLNEEKTDATGVVATPSSKAIYADASPIPATTTLTFRAPLIFVVDGYASKFRKTVLPPDAPAPIVRSHFVALLLKDADLPAPQHGHVILQDNISNADTSTPRGGPILVYQLSEHDTRMLVDVPGPKLPSMANGDLQRHLEAHVLSSLPDQLVPSFKAALANASTCSESRLRSMPNSYYPAYPQHRSDHARGCLLVGDAFNMRHPLTGGGMTVGLGDAVILTELFGGAEGLGSETREVIDLVANRTAITEAAEMWYWKRKGLTGTINVLAQALYSLFGADDVDLEVLKMACFKYFEKGGTCVSEPVSMLAGIRPSPTLLFYHFFSVAFFGIYLLFTQPLPGSKRAPSVLQWPYLFYRSLSVIWTASIVFLPVIFKELRI